MSATSTSEFVNEPILELRRASVRAQLTGALSSETLRVPVWIGDDVRHGSEREVRAAAARVAKIRTTIEPVVAALSPGSPLDDLDEALRATENGGLGGFFARRKLKKIGAQAAPLGWRTIIGKISSITDWRD